MKIEQLERKEDFSRLLLNLLNPLKPYYTEEKAGIQLGVTSTNYDEKAILMEAFSRPLWGLVPYYAGGGKNQWFKRTYVKGLAAGTNPRGKEYWGEPGEYDQRFVEMAAIAYGILMAPQVFWKPLSKEEKANLSTYLYTINEHQIPLCNWVYFRILVNIALKSVKESYSQEKIDEDLALVDSFYLGDGWYRDGDSNQKDYYVSFAIHFYGLIYAKFMEEEDKERVERLKSRSMEFAKQFIYWFDEDGAALPFGRSLTYRFAQVGFFSACILAGLEPFPMDVMKGLIVRHLNYWMSLPIFDRDDILTIGYGYPNLIMAENYNGPGSAYWSLKTFAILALPDDHEFWKVTPAPMPKLKQVCAMPYADMLVKPYKNHTTAYVPGVYSPNGHGQIVAKYSKFAYDTKFAFSVAKSNYELYENCPDSMLAFVIDGYVYVRRICEECKVTETEVYSKWSPFKGITVETVVYPTAQGHKRMHKVISEIECEAYDCGFAVAANLSDHVYKYEFKNGAKLENDKSSCQVVSKCGGGKGMTLTPQSNTNLIHAKTLLPMVQYKIHKGTTELVTEVEAEIKYKRNEVPKRRENNV